MTVNARVSVFDLVEEASKVIDTVPAGEAVAMHGDADVVFVDLRERAGARTGRADSGRVFTCPAAWWSSGSTPRSPYYKAGVFDADRRFAFYCNKDWRSALATEGRAAHRPGAGVPHRGRVHRLEGGRGGRPRAYERRRR